MWATVALPSARDLATTPDGRVRVRRACTRLLALCAVLLFAHGDIPTAGTRVGPPAPLAGRAWVLPANSGAASHRVSGPVTGRYQFWQVGLAAGPESANAGAMRTTIVTRLQQTVSPGTVNYFWVGSFLADGSFIQVGYYVAAPDPHHAGWFFCAYTARGDQGPCAQGPPGSAGRDGEVHTYALEVTTHPAPGQPAPATTWFARVDGVAVGRFPWTSGTTGPHSPAIYAESSGFSARPPGGALGPVAFTVPVQTRSAAQPSYVTAVRLEPVYAGPGVCPPYGVAMADNGAANIGSGLPCPPTGTWLT
jgi:hypothetical protein